MSTPSLIFEVGYGSTWQTEPGAITWVDETARVNDRRQMVEIVRGASSARGEVDTGTLSLTLNNADRRFDPTHTAGPLFGQLLPGVPVRVRASIGGDFYSDIYEDSYDLAAVVDLWSGTVASWPQRYDRGNTWATVPLQCFDRFDKLSRAKIPRSVLEAEVLADSPHAYWPLNETSGQVMVDASGNRRDGTYMPGTTALADVIGDQAIPALILDGENHYGTVEWSPPVNLTLEAVIDLDRVSGDLVDGQVLVLYEGGDGDVRGSGLGFLNQWAVRIVSTSAKTARLVHRGSGIFAPGGESATFRYDAVRHVALRVSASLILVPTMEHYVDGELIAGVSDMSAPSGVFDGVSIGRSKANGGQWEGGLASVAVLPLTMDSARVTVHADAALTPLEGQTTDERVDWILDEIGWPAGLRQIGPGRSILGSATFKPGDRALQYLRLIEDTEDGLLFIGPDGSLTFHDRFWPYLEAAATVSQFTFTDQDGAQGYADFQLDIDDELLVNVARYTRRDGVEQVATDSVSIAAYGEAEEPRSDLLSTTDAQVRSLAEWTVATRSVPLPRVPKIRIPLHRYSETDQATVLGLDLGHRVTVNRTPQGVGDPIGLDFLVQGVKHEVAFAQWWVDLYVSPVPQDAVELFLLGTSELGSTHILAH